MQQILPALAAQGSRFWLTAYLTRRRATRVRLYRSDGAGATFAAHATLARRTHGDDDPGFVGDYAGVAATADRVLATYVLARSTRSSPLRVYVTSVAAP